MENSPEVSEDAIKAAEEYADLRMRLQGTWQIAKEAFIAGAYYSKPIEHEQLPNDTRDKSTASGLPGETE